VRARTEVLFEMVFSTRSVQRVCRKEYWGDQVSSVQESEEAVGTEPTFREDLRPEAEEYPLLEAVTRQLLMKTQQAGKDLKYAVVIGELWR
jgi:hypothetical protein